ncbi:MAG: FAD:protein FMN transferase [Thermoguttaceae bacterium]
MTRRTNRRRFLCMTLGTVPWWLPRGRSALGEEHAVKSTRLQTATEKGWALGSAVSMTALHADRATAQRAVARAMDELRLVERLMSLYRPQSQLARLNRDGVLSDPHPYLVEVLHAAQNMSGRTGGAFDITVQPLWKCYETAAKADGMPKPDDLAGALQKVDWRQVEISTRRVRLRGKGTAVTLNGIAQGFAADRAVAVLTRHGIEHALVDTGEIGTLGTKEQDGSHEERAWTVGIQHPRRDDAYLGLAKLEGRCLATSGDYATTFSPDCRDNHLFDPRTGRSPVAFSSVSVAAATAMQADALSTALFVLGPERGLKLVQSTPKADALFVLKDGRTRATEGFPQDA